MEPSLRHRRPKGCVSSSPHIQSSLRDEPFARHPHPWVETYGYHQMPICDGQRLVAVYS